MKKLFFYFAILGLLPASYFFGGVESPVRFLYYPLMVGLMSFMSSKTLLQTALTFGILYAIMPFAKAGTYPFYAVSSNVIPFILMGVAAGRISDILRQERDSLKKTTESYQGLTNVMNLKIMNIQSKADSVSEAYERLQETERNKTRFISGVSHENSL